jgi:hypothetical protein
VEDVRYGTERKNPMHPMHASFLIGGNQTRNGFVGCIANGVDVVDGMGCVGCGRCGGCGGGRGKE